MSSAHCRAVAETCVLSDDWSGGWGDPPIPLRKITAKNCYFWPKTLILAPFDPFFRTIFGKFLFSVSSWSSHPSIHPSVQPSKTNYGNYDNNNYHNFDNNDHLHNPSTHLASEVYVRRPIVRILRSRARIHETWNNDDCEEEVLWSPHLELHLNSPTL